MQWKGIAAALFPLVVISIAGCWGSSVAQGDAGNGEKVHETCLQCHGTEVYLPPQRKVASMEALRKEVRRWGDYYNPALGEQEINDLVAYLNANFYKF